ncbi:MAG: transposase [Gammaproteobacteria bacterium]|nr:transposase [Gammaproteobacteria bacterium]
MRVGGEVARGVGFRGSTAHRPGEEDGPEARQRGPALPDPLLELRGLPLERIDGLDEQIIGLVKMLRECAREDQETGSPWQSSRTSTRALSGTTNPEVECPTIEGHFNRRYCFLPLYITRGNQVLAARVRRSKIDSAKGALGELKRMVERIRGPAGRGVRITVRADSGFCRDLIIAWCEGEEGIRYVFGLARNPRLQRRIAEDREAAKVACAESGEASRSFR